MGFRFTELLRKSGDIHQYGWFDNMEKSLEGRGRVIVPGPLEKQTDNKMHWPNRQLSTRITPLRNLSTQKLVKASQGVRFVVRFHYIASYVIHTRRCPI